eukprot:COSAG03_NODE_1082_length_4861_cov_8.532129_5_plen_49_part_00
MTGYLANDWEQLTLTVARVQQNATNTTIQFKEYLCSPYITMRLQLIIP